MNKTISLLTLGCKLNYAETSTYERGFNAAGYSSVPWGDGADVYLINTCSVTETSDKKSRSIIRKLHRVNPEAAIIVTGCYAELKREEIEKIEGVSLVFGAKEKNRLVAESLNFLEGREMTREDYERKGLAEEYREISGETLAAYSVGGRTRSFLKVQDGCNNFCAYCTVPYARGESRNIPICEIVRQAEAIAASGTKEIVLTGVNTGDFGRTTGESFLDLLKALDGIEGIERYRISSIEPNLITEEIVDWIASGSKFLPHFHIPLQTGSDIQLRRMGRKYTTDFFRDRIEYIRSRMEGEGKPKVFFGIDVMAGLPGETEELFMETYNFIASIRPAFIHVFPYSRRPGTRAAAWEDQVPEAVKAERVHRLEELCERLNSEFIEANRGIREKVLFESKEKDGNMSGFTGNYIKITRPYDAGLVGKVSDIII
ncbi:MAG: tRNA (N(6)-L-threonylcarbamoyladenosine(37)-C(2))-methylthiotransferase MtaB [Bacteroidales bacterium]|nr:tRNA (N(6)-L-threonylcarbamoyladenosine(37)-C(2))-methylthiotransferase MtaB [Candidatus Cryptobacteroides onthequi]MCQ2163796.1 tRNA (N(6)-L-threonylcarbamoyladenosine(37)-C(2))-methylthiotransferase MtaB [Bacteroidales bacterium]